MVETRCSSLREITAQLQLLMLLSKAEQAAIVLVRPRSPPISAAVEAFLGVVQEHSSIFYAKLL